jgi:hypothetical protein
MAEKKRVVPKFNTEAEEAEWWYGTAPGSRAI